MLNNPYFLKFFLICNETMRREDTYVLNAICECVKWCIDHPSFNKNNMGSVDGIMKAFFRKENGEYYYLKKKKKIKDIIVYKTESIYPYSINRILNGQKVDEEK